MSTPTDGPEFAATTTGTVHVIDDGRDAGSWDGRAAGVGEWLTRGVIGVTFCGRTLERWRGHELVAGFDDDRLCASCWKAWPGDKADLFDHPTAADG